jgi:hypothetical protein
MKPTFLIFHNAINEYFSWIGLFSTKKKTHCWDKSKGAPAKWPSSAEDLTKYGYKCYRKLLHFQHFRFSSLFGENLPFF